MSHRVTAAEVAARPTAVVAATTTWREFPALWKDLLDEVWACLRAGGVHRGCPNIMTTMTELRPASAPSFTRMGITLRKPAQPVPAANLGPASDSGCPG